MDLTVDYLRAIGVRPFVELSFMPTTLASSHTTMSRYRGSVTPPKKRADRDALIDELLRQSVARYGIDEVRQWFFRVWNQSNLSSFWTGPELVVPTLRYLIERTENPRNGFGSCALFNPGCHEQCGDIGWTSPWHYGLNQGPIVLVLESYCNGLIWRLMRECEPVLRGLRCAVRRRVAAAAKKPESVAMAIRKELRVHRPARDHRLGRHVKQCAAAGHSTSNRVNTRPNTVVPVPGSAPHHPPPEQGEHHDRRRRHQAAASQRQDPRAHR